MRRDEFDVADEREKSRTRKFIEGTVVQVGYNTALIRPKGSSGLIPCEVEAAGVAVDKIVKAEWLPGRKRRVITTVVNPPNALVPSTIAAPVTYPALPEDSSGAGWFPQERVVSVAREIPVDHIVLLPEFIEVVTGGSVTVAGDLYILTV